MVRCRIEERCPAGISETGVGGEVDRSIVVERSNGPPAVVEILGVPGGDSSVRKSVVQHSVEASGSSDVLCQTIANHQVGQTVPATKCTSQFFVLRPYKTG